MRKRAGSIGGMAFCVDCDWTLESVKAFPAIGHGAKHAKKTGHEVQVECHSVVTFNPKEETPDVPTSND